MEEGFLHVCAHVYRGVGVACMHACVWEEGRAGWKEMVQAAVCHVQQLLAPAAARLFIHFCPSQDMLLISPLVLLGPRGDVCSGKGTSGIKGDGFL